MSMSLLEKVHEQIYGGIRNDGKTQLFWDMLVKEVEKYADPKYDRLSINDYINDILTEICEAERMLGFKEGISLMLQLISVTNHAPESLISIKQAFEKNVTPVKLADDIEDDDTQKKDDD